jgi:hypothetical protein
MMEIGKREKEAGVVPDPDIDTYMKVPVSSLVFFSFMFVIVLKLSKFCRVNIYKAFCMISNYYVVILMYYLFGQAISVEGLKSTIQTDYILKVTLF